MSIPGLVFSIEITGTAFGPRSIDDAKMAMESATMRAAEFVKGLWIRAAQSLDVRQSGDYIRGIQSHGQIRKVSTTSAGNTHEVVVEIVNTAPHASIVEDGHAAFSMVHAIKWNSGKGSIKQGKNGPYLHIPFRHRAYQNSKSRSRSGMTSASAGQMMPENIYAEAKRLSHTNKYQSGGRLNRSGASQLGLGGPGGRGYVERRGAASVGQTSNGRAPTNPAWQSSKYHGMFRGGSKGHSQFMTIRTITPNSRGWNIPAQMGHGVARKVAYIATQGASAAKLQEILDRALTEALGETR